MTWQLERWHVLILIWIACISRQSLSTIRGTTPNADIFDQTWFDIVMTMSPCQSGLIHSSLPQPPPPFYTTHVLLLFFLAIDQSICCCLFAKLGKRYEHLRHGFSYPNVATYLFSLLIGITLVRKPLLVCQLHIMLLLIFIFHCITFMSVLIW